MPIASQRLQAAPVGWVFPRLLPPVASPVPSPSSSPAPSLAFAAVIFDMDGVITDTASVHARAWQRMFDEYLEARAARLGAGFHPFTPDNYRAFVDGKPRYAGVDSFLRSRGIELPWGTPADLPGRATVCGLGNRKNILFNEVIAADGVKVYPSTLALIHELRRAGVRVGLATSSRNSSLILGRTQTQGLFATVVDGLVAERLQLNGKPHPDIFITACANLGVAPARAIVVEDAVAGVRAGAAGGFGLVVGVAREDNAAELRTAGADLVVADLAEIDVAKIDVALRAKREGGR
jgi:beta-phosphoglucomutase family hydrolase